MYYPNQIEEICYEQSHIDSVLTVIEKNINEYFQKYIDSEANQSVEDETIAKLAASLGATTKPKAKPKKPKQTLERILKEAIENFEGDRQDYINILDVEALEEYKEDVGSFKNSVLRNQMPIIRRTLQNKAAKELDKYRQAFKESQPGELFNVVENIIKIANEWQSTWYNETAFELINKLSDLDYNKLDSEECTAFGVIGGGIKSHFIYKLYPYMYPNRSREAVWSLWYLSEKKHYGCKEDSEFLMINKQELTTQQNYFYPFWLFAYYAYKIYHILKELYKTVGLEMPLPYRFIAVDNFLSFVAQTHENEINLLKQKGGEQQYDH